MSTGIWVAASGATSQLTALDVAANNTANATTAGYKGEDAIFQEYLIDAARAGNQVSAMRYNGVAEVRSDHATGPIQVTDRGLDVAIRGEGFFAVQTQNGERYTRAGAFSVSPSGNLVAADGALVLNTARRPIRVNGNANEARITEGGTLMVGGEPAGQLRLVRFADQARLEKEGNTLFRATPTSGAAQQGPITLETGALEMANISVVKSMTDIVSTTRTFDALERAIDVFRDADTRAANDLMRRR